MSDYSIMVIDDEQIILDSIKDYFENLSGIKINHIYSPDDIIKTDYLKDMGFPGEYPFLRGIHATLHRGRLWTMRQFAGFGGAEETNKRYKYL